VAPQHHLDKTQAWRLHVFWGFGYLGDDLQGHVSHLGAVSDRLDAAANQARGASAPPNAFGLVGSFIPALLQPLVDQAASVIDAGRESTSETGRTMQSAVDAYRDVEDSHSGTMRDIGEALA
jgi:hypothetical protein